MAERILPQPLATDTVVVGKNIFLYINYGEGATEASPVWTLIGGQRSTSVELTADEIDASHKTSGGWKVTKAGLRGWTFSADAVTLLQDIGVEGAKKAFIGGLSAQFRLVTKDDNGVIVEAQNGWGNITSFSKEAAHDDVATLSIEISGNGALVDEMNTVDPTTADFDKSDPEDVAFTLTLVSGASVEAVKNGTTTLTANTDYTLADGTLTIKQSYLSTLDNGTATLTIETSAMNNISVDVVITGV